MTAGQELVAWFVDECVERGRNEMVQPLKGQVAQNVGKLLKEGCSPDELKAAIRVFVERRGRTALQLGEIVLELRRNVSTDAAERPSARSAAKAWIAEHGWPTGARFVRGQMGGSYVYDPLGTERLPLGYDGWPHAKPTFDDIVRALSEEPSILDAEFEAADVLGKV